MLDLLYLVGYTRNLYLVDVTHRGQMLDLYLVTRVTSTWYLRDLAIVIEVDFVEETRVLLAPIYSRRWRLLLASICRTKPQISIARSDQIPFIQTD
jgi:hypothetical protein